MCLRQFFDNYTVRQTEEFAAKVKGEVQDKEPSHNKRDPLYPEQDQWPK